MTPEQRDLWTDGKRQLRSTRAFVPVANRWRHRRALGITLNRLVKPADLRPTWIAYLTSRWTSFVVPTEVVLCDFDPARPTVGRLFEATGMVLHRGRLWDAAWREEADRFLGIDVYHLGRGDPVLLAEHWTDFGSDGHTEYRMEGWMFVSEQALRDAQRAIAQHYGARCAVVQYALEHLRGDRF